MSDQSTATNSPRQGRSRLLDALGATHNPGTLSEYCGTLLMEIEELRSASQAAIHARDRVLSHISYRIGQAIVRNSYPVWRLLLLPAALVRARRAFVAEPEAPPKADDVVSRAVPWTSAGVFLSSDPVEIEIATLGSRSLELCGYLDAFFGDLNHAAIVAIACRDGKHHGARLVEAGWKECADRPDTWIRILRGGAREPFRIRVPVIDHAARIKLMFIRQKARRPVRLLLEECSFEGIVVADNSSAIRQGSHHITPAVSAAIGESRPTVASILDDISGHCLANAVGLCALDRDRWRRQLVSNGIDWLFVESAWNGNGGSWEGELANFHWRSKSNLMELLRHCREVGIPTVFWNKDDPPHFLLFLAAAARFDYVFTTDSRSVTKYKSVLGHGRVCTLPFAADPLLHNPICAGKRLDRYCFAGSWRGALYPVRGDRIETLLEPALERGILDIFDRHGDSNDASLQFPPKYRDFVRATLPYRVLIGETYKKYRAFLNVNSVEDSPTMIARRVYELVACGTPVISSPSAAIEETFDGVVYPATTRRDVEDAMAEIEGEWLLRDRRTVRGVRLVHSEHTYTQRMDMVSRVLGRPSLLRPEREVSLICVVRKPDQLAGIASSISRQRMPPNNSAIVCLGAVQLEEADRVLRPVGFRQFVQVSSEANLAASLNDVVKQLSSDLVAKTDGGNLYGPNYLGDAVRTLTCSGAGVVGKRSYFCWQQNKQKLLLCLRGGEYQTVERVHRSTLLWDRIRTNDEVFQDSRSGPEEAFLDELHTRGVRIISSDYFNFVHVVADSGMDLDESSSIEPVAATTGNQIDENIVFV